MLRSSVALAVIASVALVMPACRMSLEEVPDAAEGAGRVCLPSTSVACMEAANHADLAWIEANVFMPSCTFMACHNGDATAPGQMDLRVGMAHTSLVNVDSQLEVGAKLVVPNDPGASYLMMMMRQIKPEAMVPPVMAPPEDIGFMPQGTNGMPVCCQKLDAVQRWIEAGAPAN